ncbi:hypothetical protein pEaSNUABM44_00260 [Erwinia phage pEa_SNUABM_44]|nr:hypothetical protein pEaSNUABM44_00260 [Erwinia phage pEa_SNUABM_44]
MTNEVSIYQRIGEAIASKGLYNIIRATTPDEETILEDSGFIKVGSIKEGDVITSLYKIELKEKEVIKIVEVPKISSPPWGNQPIDTSPWNNKPYIMYTNGTGDAEWLKNLYTNSKSDNYTANYMGSDFKSNSLVGEVVNVLNSIEKNTKACRNI